MPRRPDILRSAGLRYTFLYTGAFMLCIGLIGWLTFVTVSHTLREQAAQRVEVEASALVDEFREGGHPDLIAALDGRLANDAVRLRYAVIEPNGRVSRGDAGLAPTASNERGVGGRGLLTAVRDLGDGGRVVVADDLASVRDVEAVILRAFGIALSAAAGLGLATGVLLARTLLGRLDAVTRTAEAVVAGDLSRRIPRVGVDDEFDRLAATLNRMLDRIGALLENLRQISTDIAHDLRTPLSRLRQGLEIASRRAPDTVADRATIERAITETDAALDMFAALLRIAQIESGSRRAAFGRVDVAAVLRTVVEAYEGAVAEAGRSLHAEICGEAWIEADGDLLVQLFANLVENALQHTPSGTMIRVSLTAYGRTVVAIVRDDGPGIPEAEREKVFRRFYRLDRSRTSHGYGLGMSLVRAICELHGGKVELKDSGPGLRVSVELPRPHAHAAAQKREANTAPMDWKASPQATARPIGLRYALRRVRDRVEHALTTRVGS